MKPERLTGRQPRGVGSAAMTSASPSPSRSSHISPSCCEQSSREAVPVPRSRGCTRESRRRTSDPSSHTAKTPSSHEQTRRRSVTTRPDTGRQLVCSPVMVWVSAEMPVSEKR